MQSDIGGTQVFLQEHICERTCDRWQAVQSCMSRATSVPAGTLCAIREALAGIEGSPNVPAGTPTVKIMCPMASPLVSSSAHVSLGAP